jgi:hypothetical protein
MDNLSRLLSGILHVAIIGTMVAAPILIAVLVVVILFLH